MSAWPRTGGSVLLRDLVDSVASAISAGSFSTESTARLAELMRRFAAYAEVACDVSDASDVTLDIVGGFVRARTRDGADPATATMHLRRATVRVLFAEGRRLGLVDHDPTLDLHLPPRTSFRTRPLTDDEVLLCRSYAVRTLSETRQPTAWALAEATARSAELARVRIQDLDLNRSRVWLAGGSKTEARWGTLSAWGRVQIQRRLRVLERAASNFPLVCGTAKLGVSATSSASVAIATTLRRAGLGAEPDVRPSSVAAWAGARALADGMPIAQVARMLGIRSLDRTADFAGWAWNRPLDQRGEPEP